jgi:broad specificity phosphatase PhoE
LSSLYLFRHGQAGLRHDYDTLSVTGREQADRLGRYLAGQNIRFRAFFTGALQRQQETARRICAAYTEAGLEIPDPVIDPCWNEFDLAAVYNGVSPQLAADDEAFRLEYEALQVEAADHGSTVHRRWTSSDIAVVRAWVEGRYQYDGESWSEFTKRVQASLRTVLQFGPGDAIAVSTSATPIAVWIGLALALDGRHVMRLAGAQYNASVTSFRLRDGEPHLFGFNHIPHLADASLRTFR